MNQDNATQENSNTRYSPATKQACLANIATRIFVSLNAILDSGYTYQADANNAFVAAEVFLLEAESRGISYAALADALGLTEEE